MTHLPGHGHAHSEQQRIDAELVDHFYRNVPAPVLALNAVLATLLVLLLRDAVSWSLLTAWVAFVSLVAVLNGWRNVRYRRAYLRDDFRVEDWQRDFGRGALLNGFAWGLGGALLYTPAAPVPSMFVLLTICGVAAGSVASQSSLPRALHSFLFPAILLPALRMLTIQDSQHAAVALLLCFYLGFLVFVSRTNHRVLLDSVELRFSNELLLGALTKSERHFRSLIENALDWVSVVRTDGCFSFQSPSVETLLGWKPEELQGRDVLAQLHPDDRALVKREFDRVFAESGVAAIEARWRHRDGRWLTLQGLVRPLGGDVPALVMNARDVTERRAIERDLRRAKEAAEAASRIKDQFLASMSHEIRTPLHAMQGMADLLSETKLDPRQREYVAGFQEASGHLSQLVNDILDFSRMNAGGLTLAHAPFDLRALLDGVLALLSSDAQAKGLALHVAVAPEVKPLRLGDVVRLRQVLVNLVGNAVKFTDAGEVRVMVEDRERALHFTVTDTGRGIPPEKLDLLFRPFSQLDASPTREFGGVGLGLAISRGLVQAMGGTITVESRVGEGSAFRFSVPLPAAKALQVTEATPPPSELPPARILVADDAELNRMVVREFFRGTPCRLDFVVNGREAVEAWAQGHYDLILMDIQMPEMDGWEATRAIRKREAQTGRRAVPIIAVTAGALDEDRSNALLVGCTDYLPKPVTKGRLLALVGSYLDGTVAREERLEEGVGT